MEDDQAERSKEEHQGQGQPKHKEKSSSHIKHQRQHRNRGRDGDPQNPPTAEETEQIQRNNQPWTSQETLTIIYGNARSILSKINDLQALAEDKKPEIILVSETWLIDNINAAVLNIDGYTLESNLRCDRKDTSNGIGGGLLVYSKLGLNIVPIENINSFNQYSSFTIKGKGKDNDLNVHLVYRPPSSNQTNNDLLLEVLKSVDKNSIIIGDFNLPKIDWKTETGNDQKSRSFLEAIDEAELTQLVDFPTHNRGNILDLVVTNIPEKVLYIDCLENLGNSDHSILSVEIICSATVTSNEEYIPDWNKGDTAALGEFFTSINWDSRLYQKNTEDSWETFCEIINEGINRFIPKIKRKFNSKPKWLNRRIVRLARKKEKLWKNYIKENTHYSFEQYKKVEKETKKAVQNAKRKVEKKLAKDQNLRGFYSYVKSKTKNKDTIGPLKQNSEIITEAGEIARILNEYFNSVCTNEDLTNIPVPTQRNVASPVENIYFTPKIVADKIKTLKSSPATGPDDISAIFLQQYVEQLCHPLSIIYNRYMSSGHVPQVWKDGNITPIFKKGVKGDPGNYRPISLTSVPCKIMEAIIKDQIVNHLSVNELIFQSQHGFMNKKSVLTNLLEFFETVTREVDLGQPVDVIYLDYSKAFDKVPHNRLIRKMESNGIKGNILHWITQWLSNRRQRVVINGSKSDWLPVLSGVPQGSVLGPLAFIIFINDLDEATRFISAMNKFADDSKVANVINTPKDHEELQKSLDSLCEWADRWGMQFNEKKCKVVHFGHSNKKLNYEMNGIQLEKSSGEKDLGVHIEQSLKPSKQCTEAVRKAKVALNSISRAFHFRDRKVFLRLYYQYVRSHLEYATPAWNPWQVGDCELLEKVQKKAINMISGLSSVTYEEKLNELGIQSLADRRLRFDLIQTYKIIHQVENVSCSTWFKMVDNSRNINTRLSSHHLNIQPTRSNLDIRSYFFSNRVIIPWNALPSHTKEAPNLKMFKTLHDRTWKDR